MGYLIFPGLKIKNAELSDSVPRQPLKENLLKTEVNCSQPELKPDPEPHNQTSLIENQSNLKSTESITIKNSDSKASRSKVLLTFL